MPASKFKPRPRPCGGILRNGGPRVCASRSLQTLLSCSRTEQGDSVCSGRITDSHEMTLERRSCGKKVYWGLPVSSAEQYFSCEQIPPLTLDWLLETSKMNHQTNRDRTAGWLVYSISQSRHQPLPRWVGVVGGAKAQRGVDWYKGLWRPASSFSLCK